LDFLQHKSRAFGARLVPKEEEQRFTAALSRDPTLADSHRGEYKPTMGMSMKKPD
jgi:hypothetical protein